MPNTAPFRRFLKNAMVIILILLNVFNLYFIIQFAGYDEIIGYMGDGVQKISCPRSIALVFLLTAVPNLLFILLVYITMAMEH